MASRSALLTVLFTDIVGSTEIADELGDRRWQELLSRHHRVVRTELRRFGGREVDTAGDGFFAVFDRPEDAVRCAAAIADAVRELGIEVRAGVHAGQVELTGRRVGGVAVHVGARIGAAAGPGEVLVSGTLRDLLPGAMLSFEDRGVKNLKGVAQPQPVFAVSAVQGRPRGAPLDEDEARARREAATIPAPSKGRRRVLLLAAVAIVAGVATTTWFIATRDGDERTPPAVAAPVGTVVKIDPETNEASTPIRGLVSRNLGFVTPAVEAGEGGVWVLNGQTGLEHVDPSTGEVTTIPLDASADGIALGHGRLWVTIGRAGAGRLVALSPGDLAVTREIELEEPVAHRGFLVAVTDDAIWTASQGVVTRVHPISGRKQTFETGGPEDDIVAAGGDLWLVDRFEDRLARFDTRANRIVETIELQTNPERVVAGEGGGLWLLDEFGRTVTPISQDGQLGRAIPAGENPTALAVGDDSVWVGGGDGTVRRIDPALGREVAVIDVGAPVQALDVDPATGEVWAYLAAGSRTGGGFG